MKQLQPRIAVLVRHGDTGAHERSHLVGGRSEHLPLQPRGERQAVELGRVLLPTIGRVLQTAGLATRGQEINVADFSASPTVRTRATAAGLVLGVLGVGHELSIPKLDARLTEWSKGHTEGQERIRVETPSYKARAETDGWRLLPDADYPEPTAETPRMVQDRGYQYLQARPTYSETKAAKVSLGVSHGYTMSFTLARALLHETALSPQEATAAYLPNYASGYVLVSAADQSHWTLAGTFAAPEVSV